MMNKLSRLLVSRCWTFLGLSLLILAGLTGSFAKNGGITVDGSIESFLGKHDPAIVLHNEFKEKFGDDSDIVLVITAPTVVNIEFLEKLVSFQSRILAEVPHIEDISSLYNARDSRGDEASFRVEDLLNPMPNSEQDLQLFREKLLANPLYSDILYSKNFDSTTIIVKPERFVSVPDSDSELAWFDHDTGNKAQLEFITPDAMATMVEKIQALVAEVETPDFQIAVAGSPVASSEIVRLMNQDMPKFARVSLLLVFIGLFVTTRRISYVVLPVFVIAASVVSMFGSMSLAGVSLKPPTQMLLSVVIVASICTTTHLLAVYFRYLDEGMEKKQAASKSLSHCILPIFFTCLTTALSLAALFSSNLAPIKELGIFGALAVFAVMLNSYVFFAVYVNLYKIWWKKTSEEKRVDVNTFAGTKSQKSEVAVHVMSKISFAAVNNPKVTAATVVLLTLVAVLGITKLQASHNALKWLDENNATRADIEYADSAFNSTISLEAIYSRNGQSGIRNETDLTAINRIAETVPSLSTNSFSTGKVIAISDIAKEVNKTIYGNDYQYFAIPKEELLSTAFLLFENSGSEDLEYYATSDYQEGRLSIRMPWMEAFEYSSFIERFKALNERELPSGLSVQITGLMSILANTSAAVIDSMISSYLISLIVITLLMLVVLKDVCLGLFSMLPNVLPIALGLAFMGYQSIPLDTFTLTIGCVALGLVVDDTIHFFHTFKSLYDNEKSFDSILQRTIELSGVPILLTSIVLMVGYAAYITSSLSNVRSFGMVMVVIVFVALMCELIFSPLIAKYWYQKQANKAARTFTQEILQTSTISGS